MDALPENVLLSIISHLKLYEWLTLQLVSKRLRSFILQQESTIESLDILVDFLIPEGKGLDEHTFDMDFIDLEHLTLFLFHQFPRIKTLNLRGCPIYVSFADLAHLAKYLPNLESLSLSRIFNYPKVSHNTLVALPEFRKLNVLNIDGSWIEKNKFNLPPVTLFANLKEISMQDSDVLFILIDALRASNQQLTQLTSFHAGMRKGEVMTLDQVNALIWFFESHPNLTHVELSQFYLNSRLYSWMIMLKLIAIPKLQRLTIVDCWCEEKEIGAQDLPSNVVINGSELRSLNLLQTNILTESFVSLLRQQYPDMVISA